MKQEIVLKDETPRSESSQSATGEVEKTSTNRYVVNDMIKLKLKGHLKHRSERKLQCFTTQIIGT